MSGSTRKLNVETLEKREVFAGNVAAWVDGAGVLQLSGDNYGNSVSVNEVALNTFEVRGYNTAGANTQINGSFSPQRFYSRADKINAVLNGGNDGLTVNGVKVAALNVNMGAGSDSLTVSNSTVYGYGSSANLTLGLSNQNEVDNVYLYYDQFYGNLYTSLGGGNDYASFDGTRIDGYLSAYAETGWDSYRWNRSSYARLGAWQSFEQRYT